jgi:hypothetical protein
MKKWSILLSVFVVFAFTAVSYASQSNTGCGVGNMIFKGKEGLLSQTLAVTTNGILGNQTFGITSGTLDCRRANNLVMNEKIKTFVADNMDNLARDIAKGSGEHLTTLAVLMEISEGQRAVFYSKLQTNFAKIYTSDTVSHSEVIKNIETVMSAS